eukprot:14571690-Alexandrium_andersonii.AAC.1
MQLRCRPGGAQLPCTLHCFRFRWLRAVWSGASERGLERTCGSFNACRSSGARVWGLVPALLSVIWWGLCEVVENTGAKKRRMTAKTTQLTKTPVTADQAAPQQPVAPEAPVEGLPDDAPVEGLPRPGIMPPS